MTAADGEGATVSADEQRTGAGLPRPGGGTAEAVRRGPTIDGRAMAVALGAPALAVAAIVGTDLWLGDRLGDVVVHHWGPSGEPDAWGSRTGFVLTIVLTAGLVSLACTLTAGFARVWTALRRPLLATGTWVAVLTGGLGVISLLTQRDGARGDLGWSAFALLAVGGLGVAAVAWRVPRDLVPPVLATAPPSPDLPRSSADGVAAHPVGMGGRLEVTDATLVVRWLGGTALRIPVAEVAAAEPTRLSAGSFGGWGLRTQPGTGTYAFVGRGTTAVEVRRADGTRWLVTTPHAEDVAGVLNAAADRHHA